MLEVIVLGLVLIVPLVWLLSVLAEVHRAALATNSAAREVGWELARGASADSVDAAGTAAFNDHGLAPEDASVSWTGRVERGGTVAVTASYPVHVASFPLLGRLPVATVRITARHRAHIPVHRSER